MVRFRSMMLLQSILVVTGFFLLRSSEAEEECLSGTSLCYECDSWSDPRCKDPFNWTALPSELPSLMECKGCCVKIVTNAEQPNEAVRRTCTKNLVINLFMVDHVCMYEGHKTGHMCFCEGDHCNVGPTIRSSFFAILGIVVLMIVILPHLLL